MQDPPLGVADLVRAAGEDFLVRSRGWLRSPHRKVLSAIARCRTAALGAHRLRCDDCGHSPPLVYNSCLDRHCPQCQAGTRKRWLESRRKELLPVRYLHVVFTLPRVLSQLALQNKKTIYSLLMRAPAASHSIRAVGSTRRRRTSSFPRPCWRKSFAVSSSTVFGRPSPKAS
jgi:hypothetical protein